MSPTAQEKRLVLLRIDSRRELLRLELEAVGRSTRSLSGAFAWGRWLAPLWTTLLPAARSLRGKASATGWAAWLLRFAPLLLLLVPLLRRARRSAASEGERSAGDGEG